MHITELRIRHYRNFMKSRFHFREGVNTLIGENGSGKTNALEALRLLLDESLSRNAPRLRETDFCRDIGQWQGHWIIISVDFADLDPSEGCQLIRHNMGHMDETNTGTYTYFFRPKSEVRKRLFEMAQSNAEVKDFVDGLTVGDYEPVFTGRAEGDFLDDDVYRRWVGDLEARIYPNPDDDDQSILGVKVQAFHEEVACTFVRALRDVVAELRGFRSNPILTLLRGLESKIEIGDARRISQQVANLNADISSLAEIRQLAVGIEASLEKTVGPTYAPGVRIESALPDSMEKLLQRLIVLVGQGGAARYHGELQEQSLGGANLIYLALKLLEYELKLSSDRVAHFLLIEEPEAHIHTHIQKSLFFNLPTERTQVIVSTHSTHISSASKIASVNVLAIRDDHAEVFQPSHELSSRTVMRVERYLDAVRSTLLFAKGVMLVEGDAEQIMIPSLLRALFGVTPDELGFSVITMSSAFFEHIMVLFAEERIRRPCAVVTDLDVAVIDLPDDQSQDSDEHKRARASQIAGRRRSDKLQNLVADNRWTRAFFANHTFEVDFLDSGNSATVVSVLDEIYQQEAAINRSTNQLRSADIRESGTEILRLANKVGKGWFALLVAERLGPAVSIPEYLLRAIAFVCHHSVRDELLWRMAQFRLSWYRGVGTNVEGFQTEDEPPGAPRELIQAFCVALPNDQLSHFVGFVEEYKAER